MQQPVIHTATPTRLTGLLNPVAMIENLWSHRELVWQMAKRDIEGRYKAARLGLLWSILTPLCMLAIYTFVFTTVFRSKWRGTASEAKGMFALTMFSGMLLYNLFAEVVNRAPTMVVWNPNYVKKVVFPLEVFIPSAIISALINMLIGYGVWLVGWFVVRQEMLPWTVVLFPLVVVPVCIMAAGIGWFLASLGVFVRDIGHMVVLATQVLFFITPIFYPIDAVPYPYRHVLELNPLAHAVEDVRRVLLSGEIPQWPWWIAAMLISSVLAVFGYAFFMKSKRAFADVV